MTKRRLGLMTAFGSLYESLPQGPPPPPPPRVTAHCPPASASGVKATLSTFLAAGDVASRIVYISQDTGSLISHCQHRAEAKQVPQRQAGDTDLSLCLGLLLFCFEATLALHHIPARLTFALPPRPRFGGDDVTAAFVGTAPARGDDALGYFTEGLRFLTVRCQSTWNGSSDDHSENNT